MSKSRLAALAKIFPSCVAIEGGAVASVNAELYPTERDIIASAVDSRRLEFTAGRYFSRSALRRLGVAETAISVRPDRTPDWPEGIVGSISHAQGFCAAVVAQRSELLAVGLDIESVSAVNPALWPQLFSAREQAWLKRQHQYPQMLAASLLFSAKECFYKCQYTLTRQWLDFSDVELKVDPQRQFNASLTRTIGEGFNKGYSLKGQYLVTEQLVFCGMSIAA